MASELKARDGAQGVAVLYQPHQNSRQHEVKAGYKKAFIGADKVFWLPTYLTREDPNLAVLSPAELISEMENADIAEPAELNDTLAAKIRQLHQNGWIIILITAGPADTWFRNCFLQD